MNQAYRQEIDDLESKIITWNPKRSLRDLLFLNLRSLVPIMNENLKKIYEQCNCNFESKFPYYGCLLNVRYKHVHIQRKRRDAAKICLDKALGMKVLDICCDKIFSYLNRSDFVVFDREFE